MPSKKSLKLTKSINVEQGLISQGYEMNWAKASSVAKGMKLAHEAGKRRMPPALQREANAIAKYRKREAK